MMMHSTIVLVALTLLPLASAFVGPSPIATGVRSVKQSQTELGVYALDYNRDRDYGYSTYGGYRDELAHATDQVMNLNVFPYGTLNRMDVEQISPLMEGWLRRRTDEGARKVMDLYERVREEQRYGNYNAQVLPRMHEMVRCFVLH